MFVIGLFFLAPICLIAYWLWLFFKKQRRGLLVGVLSFTLTVVLGSWAILQSRSSTAGIGFLFIPFYSSIAGLMGFASSLVRNKKALTVQKALSPSIFANIFADFLLLLVFAMNGFFIYSAIKENTKNKARETQNKNNQIEIDNNRKFIKDGLLAHAGQESLWLNAQIQSHAVNRNFLLPALEESFVSEEILTQYAKNSDMGLRLTVARNKKTPAPVLAMIYKEKDYPFYYYQALADNPNTPNDILAELYENKESRAQSALWLAKNPSTPYATLLQISLSNDLANLHALLGNKSVDCKIVKNIESQLQKADLTDTYHYRKGIEEQLKKFTCQ